MAKKKYFLDASTFQRIKSLDFAEMNEWLERFYRAAFEDGKNSVQITDSAAVIEEIGKIKGIGPKRKEIIRETIERM